MMTRFEFSESRSLAKERVAFRYDVLDCFCARIRGFQRIR